MVARGYLYLPGRAHARLFVIKAVIFQTLRMRKQRPTIPRELGQQVVVLVVLVVPPEVGGGLHPLG